MSLAGVAIEKKAVSWFGLFLLTVAGIAGFFSLGQLEDPEFTIRSAFITTSYPGATAQEVELEVTDKIELVIQEMKELDYVESWSRPGLSTVKAEIKAKYRSDEILQIWDLLRQKIRDVENTLPPGVGRPAITDDFGDVFGLLLAITSDGYSYQDLDTYVKELRKELSLVEGVARVDIWGKQDRAIYLDVRESQLVALGLSQASIEQTLRYQNAVVDAGHTDVQNRRLRVAPTGQFTSPGDIEDLVVRPTLTDSLQARSDVSVSGPVSDLIRIGDIGEIVDGYREPPSTLMRFDGQMAMALAIANQPGVNVVEMGRKVDARLAELIATLPNGIEVHRAHWQSDVVDQAVKGFFVSLAQAVGIVLVVLTLVMGWRMGVVIGSGLILTIVGTLLVMAILHIDLQRMSLGALVIALGMMVDNAIVVADGYAVRLQKGMEKVKAAVEAASQPAIPLLGATVIAVMAFYPIYASEEAAGEYCVTLFTVVAIALLISWVISMVATPLQCLQMLPSGQGGGDQDPYGGRFYRVFRTLLRGALRMRYLTVAGAVGLLVVSAIGFAYVPQLFFPSSSMPKFMIDYWAPEGIRIQNVARDVEALEEKLLADDRVEAVATFIGAGPPRFYLPVDPEGQSAAYAQLIVNVKDFRDIDAMADEYDAWVKRQYPQSLVPIRKYGIGPSNTWEFEARISGPALADAEVLREIGERGLSILAQDPYTGSMQTDWRHRTMKLSLAYNDARARWARVNREDLAATTKRAFDGRTIGLYRESDELIPIVLRHVEEEREDVSGIELIQVRPGNSSSSVPLAQVIDGISVKWEEPIIGRHDRRRTITIQANPIPGITLPTFRAGVLEEFEELERSLPPGYKMEWGGEHEDSAKAQASLIPGVIPAVAVVLFIIVALFNAYRPPLVIVSVIPFVAIGITAGLLATGVPFGFVALLGAMSLVGMMIKNAIVLLDQINLNLAEGMNRYDATVEAAVSRLRPVALAAGTTVLGVIPLLQDVFWISLAITLMAGLSFGTLITMFLVPVIYAILYRAKPEVSAET
jgi:multidrug efflux pump subunit AcrB